MLAYIKKELIDLNNWIAKNIKSALVWFIFGIFIAAIWPTLLFLILIALSELSILFWKIFYIDLLISSLVFQCVLVLIATNPIYALLTLIVVFFSSAVILLSFQVQFLALIYLIVYIGAIAILFLFVIMMFNLKYTHRKGSDTQNVFLYSFFIYNVFGFKFIYVLFKEFNSISEHSLYFNQYATNKLYDVHYTLSFLHSDILIFSNLLYTYYSFIFLLSGMLLFVSMIGSIVLALSTTEAINDNKFKNYDIKL